MTYSYDEDPKKHKLAQQDAKDRKITYLEELVRTGIEQQKKWQQKYFELREIYLKYVETDQGTKDINREDMQ